MLFGFDFGICQGILQGINASCMAAGNGQVTLLGVETAASPTTTLSFTGLDASSFTGFMFVGVIYTTIDNADFVLRLNGETTNQYTNGIIGEGSAFAKGTNGQNVNLIDTSVIAQPATGMFWGSINGANGEQRTVRAFGGTRQDGTSTTTTDFTSQLSHGWWTATDDLTSVEFVGPTNGFGTGSFIALYSVKGAI